MTMFAYLSPLEEPKAFFGKDSYGSCSFCKASDDMKLRDVQSQNETKKKLRIVGPVFLGVGVLIAVIACLYGRSSSESTNDPIVQYHGNRYPPQHSQPGMHNNVTYGGTHMPHTRMPHVRMPHVRMPHVRMPHETAHFHQTLNNQYTQHQQDNQFPVMMAPTTLDDHGHFATSTDPMLGYQQQPPFFPDPSFQQQGMMGDNFAQFNQQPIIQPAFNPNSHMFDSEDEHTTSHVHQGYLFIRYL